MVTLVNGKVDERRVAVVRAAAPSGRFLIAFPPEIHTHNRVLDLYIDHDGLIARHDYAPEILGGTPAAHYLSGYSQFDGIMFPTHRKCCPAAATIDPTPRRS